MTDKAGNKGGRPRARARSNAAFLLTQVGTHAALKFAERVAHFDLAPPHIGILNALSSTAGMSQQALSAQLSVMPSRLVVLLDELEERKLVERRDDPEDRRSYALHLTDGGRKMMESIGALAREHNEELLKGLTSEERGKLTELLQRIADAQGLTPGVHPGYSRLGRRGKRSR